MSASAAQGRPIHDLIDIDVTVRGVVEDFLGLDVTPQASTREALLLTAVVHVVGDWAGSVVVRGTEAAAVRCASAMFDTPPDELSHEDVSDAWGELTNLVAGAVVQNVPGGRDLTPPTIIRGPQQEVSLAQHDAVLHGAYQLQGAPFHVTVHQTRSSEEG